MRRGEIWWTLLPEPVGRRPVVLVSRDEAYQVRTDVTVAPVTTRIRDIPTFVPLGRDEGLSRPCAANFDSLMTIPKRTLVQLAGALGPDKISAMDSAIRFALDLPGV